MYLSINSFSTVWLIVRGGWWCGIVERVGDVIIERFSDGDGIVEGVGGGIVEVGGGIVEVGDGIVEGVKDGIVERLVTA